MEKSIKTWFFESETLMKSLTEVKRPIASMEMLESHAKACGFSTFSKKTDEAQITRLRNTDVIFSQFPNSPDDIGLILVRWKDKLTRKVVAHLYVYEDASVFTKAEALELLQENFRMQWLNGKWVAHVTTRTLSQTGDPLGTDPYNLLGRLVEAIREQYDLLAFRRKLRTQVLWEVKGLNGRVPFRYYFVSPSVPTITENCISFDRAFIWLTNGKAFAVMPRKVDCEKFLSIEARAMFTSDLDVFSAAQIGLVIDFDHAELDSTISLDEILFGDRRNTGQ